VPVPVEQRSADFEKYLLWSVAIALDGATVYAINPALGVVDEFDAHQMTLRRTARITVSRADQGVLATIERALFPVAEAKRYITGGALLSPDGRIYAAAYKGIAVVDATTLSSRAGWQTDGEFDALATTTSIVAGDDLRAQAELLRDQLRPASGYPLLIAASANGSRITLALDRSLANLGDEGYRLTVHAEEVAIRAPQPAGILHG